MKPVITVITPCFNSIQFIELCLQNVITQKCPEVEHLIMDAKSTDGTLEIIQKYAKEYPHIHYVSEADNGQSDAMNKGIKIAKGEIISFLNVDDGYFTFVLNRVLGIFKANYSLNFITGNCKLFDLQGNLLYINRPQRLRPYHIYSSLEPFPINPAAYFYKKELHNKLGYYNVDNHYNMDLEFILKVIVKVNIIYFNEDWGIMVQHELAKTSLDEDIGLRKKELIKSYQQHLTFTQKQTVLAYKIFKKIWK
jgi:glycosyltransferase involved in cell wall biosynthesis